MAQAPSRRGQCNRLEIRRQATAPPPMRGLQEIFSGQAPRRQVLLGPLSPVVLPTSTTTAVSKRTASARPCVETFCAPVEKSPPGCTSALDRHRDCATLLADGVL